MWQRKLSMLTFAPTMHLSTNAHYFAAALAFTSLAFSPTPNYAQEAPAKPAQVLSDAANLKAETVIPGVMPVDVYLNLEQRGFTTRRDHSTGNMVCYSKRDFRDHFVNAETYCVGFAKIHRVVMTVINPSSRGTSEKASTHLEFLATLPYQGSVPDEAVKWVRANIDKKLASTTIGTVRFEIIGNAGFRSMSMWVKEQP